MQRKVQ
jgi:hypothetical protein